MIYIFWEEIKDDFLDFLFFFRILFCKNFWIGSHGLGYCLKEENKIYDSYGCAIGHKYCCKENCPKRKRREE